MAATRPVLVKLSLDQRQLLDVLAEYRRLAPEDLAADILADWIGTAGRRELMRRLASPPPERGHPSPRRRELAGQLTVDDALRDAG
ncbi:MAG TPA: hypothetical protein VFH54_12635 [Mycobacteriales bacterium]|nr:hypothetical protein [Mycobacteriales bacterium]